MQKHNFIHWIMWNWVDVYGENVSWLSPLTLCIRTGCVFCAWNCWVILEGLRIKWCINWGTVDGKRTNTASVRTFRVSWSSDNKTYCVRQLVALLVNAARIWQNYTGTELAVIKLMTVRCCICGIFLVPVSLIDCVFCVYLGLVRKIWNGGLK